MFAVGFVIMYWNFSVEAVCGASLPLLLTAAYCLVDFWVGGTGDCRSC